MKLGGASLRQLSPARILPLQGTPNASSPLAAQVGLFPDGTIVPVQPEVGWTTGQFNHMPTMTGLVRRHQRVLLWAAASAND
jgi:hypothetical protein